MEAWEHLESSVFLLHIRTATWGQLSDANTQPFSRSHGGRDWLFVHAGSLAQRFPRAEDAAFTPVGSTDTEAIFCDLLGRFAKKGWRSLGDAAPHELRDWFEELNRLGTITAVLTDGRDLCVYADAGDRVSIETNDRAERGIYVWKLVPPYGELSFGDDDLEVDLADAGVKSRKGAGLVGTARAHRREPRTAPPKPRPASPRGRRSRPGTSSSSVRARCARTWGPRPRSARAASCRPGRACPSARP